MDLTKIGIRIYNKGEIGAPVGFMSINDLASSESEDATIVSIDSELPSEDYSSVNVTMSKDVGLGDVFLHMNIKGTPNGTTSFDYIIGKHTTTELYANTTQPEWAITVSGNIITITDVTGGHGNPIYSITWE